LSRGAKEDLISSPLAQSHFGRNLMQPRWILALMALLCVPGPALAAKLDAEACRKVKGEHEALMAAGVRGDMGRGPEWAKANLPPERLERIKRWLTLEEDLRFKCNEARPTSLKPGSEDPEDGEAAKPAAAPAPVPAARKKAAQPAPAAPPAPAAAPAASGAAQPAPEAQPKPAAKPNE
jgi:hypothetical protein